MGEPALRNWVPSLLLPKPQGGGGARWDFQMSRIATMWCVSFVSNCCFQHFTLKKKHRKNYEYCPVSLLIVRYKDCHEFRFSIVRTVISLSNLKVHKSLTVLLKGVRVGTKVGR